MRNTKLHFAVGIAILFALTPAVFGQSNQPEARFTFTAVNATEPGPAGGMRLDLVIDDWSSDDVRDAVFSALDTEPAPGTFVAVDPVLTAVSEGRMAGYMHWPGGGSYPLSYARRVALPDGGQDIILLVQPNPWVFWNDQDWENAPYAVFQIRFNSDGVGEGKLASSEEVVANRDAGVALQNFESRPVLLADVRSDT